jgi:hypothetical protein
MLLIIGNYFRLNSKKYSDFEDVCFDIQSLMYLSKYNLKRNQNKENSKSITFVCSCISKKDEKVSQNGAKKNVEDDFENSFLCSESDISQKLKRKVKRHNKDPCHFRIKFKITKDENKIFLTNDSKFHHNHPPNDKGSVKVNILTNI